MRPRRGRAASRAERVATGRALDLDGEFLSCGLCPSLSRAIEAQLFRYKRLRELLHEWELLTADEIIAPEPNED